MSKEDYSIKIAKKYIHILLCPKCTKLKNPEILISKEKRDIDK